MNKAQAIELLEDYKKNALKIIAGEPISFQILHAIDMCLGCNLTCTDKVTREELEELEITKEIYSMFPKLIEIYNKRIANGR